MQLSDVSRTAVITLRSRVIESQKATHLIRDPMAAWCLERLETLASSREEQTLLFERRLSPALTMYIALRARKYDAITNAFIAQNPSCLVVNLGCGFDTRYWRIDHGRCEYVELDLPEMVALKREVLGERLAYDMIGASVLNRSWMDRVSPGRDRRTLVLAEGLFMYLPKAEVMSLFRDMSRRFCDSRIAFEVTAERYTRGLWKKLVIWKMKRQTGFDAGSSYDFGVRSAREIESYGPGIQVIDEWSYVDDPDVRPRILKYLRLSRTQWTVTASIGAQGTPAAVRSEQDRGGSSLSSG